MILIDDGIGHSGDYYKEYDLDVNLWWCDNDVDNDWSLVVDRWSLIVDNLMMMMMMMMMMMQVKAVIVQSFIT